MCLAVQIHIDHELCGVFSSMTSDRKKQTQINSRHSQRDGTVKRRDNEIKKLACLCAEKNEQNF